MAIVYRCFYNEKSYIGVTTRSMSLRINEHKCHSKFKTNRLYLIMRIATIQERYGKDFVVYCKKTGDFLGKFRNKKECGLKIGYDDSALGKILKGTRGSNKIRAHYVEV